MEENLAILLADISGYTALTETHGSSSAADVIDKFIGIIEDSLTGSSRLHQSIGDEVMIVSSSADDIVATALAIIEKTSSENNFPQLHGGLHYGSILKRRENYFGTTINLASRITSRAASGKFLCSEEFLGELVEFGDSFIPSGEESFKNLSGTRRVFELIHQGNKSIHIDPVCRMQIHDIENAVMHEGESGIYFCSEHCAGEWRKSA